MSLEIINDSLIDLYINKIKNKEAIISKIEALINLTLLSFYFTRRFKENIIKINEMTL